MAAGPDTQHHGNALPFQIAAALILAYLITVHTLAAAYSTSSPQTANMLSPSEPVALTRRAERALPAIMGITPSASEGRTDAATGEQQRLEGFARLPKLDLRSSREDGDSAAQKQATTPAAAEASKAEAKAWLERAILAHPLNAQAISLLAVLAIGEGEDAKAARLMSATVARSGRIPLANYWLMRSSFDAKDYATSLGHADRLLRNTPLNIGLAAPFLGRLAEAAPAEMTALLAQNPAWRMGFFVNLKGNIKDARTPLNMLLKLKETAHPLVPREISAYVALLMENGYNDLAYSAWLQSLAPEQLTRAGFVYNGGFDIPPSGVHFPFEWSLQSGAGFIADIATSEGENGNSVLMLKFGPGRAAHRPVGQTTMLAPGDYTLHGRFRGDIKSRRGLKWSVACAVKPFTSLATSEPINGRITEWTEFKLDFSVPKENCRPQTVQLDLDARSASETLVSGSLLVDDVSLLRQGEAQQGE